MYVLIQWEIATLLAQILYQLPEYILSLTLLESLFFKYKIRRKRTSKFILLKLKIKWCMIIRIFYDVSFTLRLFTWKYLRKWRFKFGKILINIVLNRNELFVSYLELNSPQCKNLQINSTHLILFFGNGLSADSDKTVKCHIF